MRNKGTRNIQVSPIDDEPRGRQVHDLHPGSGPKVDVLFDQKLFDRVIRRERSSAYWFAASLWGVSGLVLGALLGGFMMFQAYVGLTPPVRDTLVQGQAIREATDSVNSRDPILRREDGTNSQPSQP